MKALKPRQIDKAQEKLHYKRVPALPLRNNSVLRLPHDYVPASNKDCHQFLEEVRKECGRELTSEETKFLVLLFETDPTLSS